MSFLLGFVLLLIHLGAQGRPRAPLKGLEVDIRQV